MCELGTWFDAPWKRGWLGLVTNNNGHQRESKFDNEDEHCHFHTNIFQTFLAWFHKHEQILSRLLQHVGQEIIYDPMLNDQLECTLLFWMIILRATIGRHSCETMFFQILPFLLA
jgi:hypothetical protein